MMGKPAMTEGPPTTERLQGGFSLIEAMVALLVLSVGLLGMAAIQTRALSDASQAYDATLATLAGVDAQERLWEQLFDAPCTDITASHLQSEWRQAWFSAQGAPLQAYASGTLELDGDNECRFIISVPVAEGFSYRLRLPGS